MSTVAAPAARADQSAPELPPLRPVRHGTARLLMCINGDVYKIRRRPALKGACAWALVKATGERTGAVYAVVRAKGEVTCSCPDHSQNNAECKHVRALVACGLLARASARPLPRKGVARA